MMRAIALLALLGTTPTGCGAAPAIASALTHLSAGVQWLDAVLDAAGAGAAAYSMRHPNPELDGMVVDKLRRARLALAALTEAISKGQDGDIEKARKAAIEAYDELRQLLLSTGILDARPPSGGAENELAPIPQPLALPSTSEIADALHAY